MKTLSLLQPWASLVVGGHKQIETRSWSTKYRGPLLIHASKKFTGAQLKLSCDFANRLQDYRTLGGFGSIIGMVELLDTLPTEYCLKKNYSLTIKGTEFLKNGISEQEEAFGDYSEGRFGWLLSKPVLFKDPIPCRGSLSIWKVPDELLPEIEKQRQLAQS